MSTDRQFVLAELEQPCSLTVKQIKVFPIRASPALDKPLVSFIEQKLICGRSSSKFKGSTM